ncbi:MAG: hypothetical protein L6R19_08340 [Alphaproteobacteria bacterium]|nr:hypothetical protein [Alphaproteobacteria bacterium]
MVRVMIAAVVLTLCEFPRLGCQEVEIGLRLDGKGLLEDFPMLGFSQTSVWAGRRCGDGEGSQHESRVQGRAGCLVMIAESIGEWPLTSSDRR